MSRADNIGGRQDPDQVQRRFLVFRSGTVRTQKSTHRGHIRSFTESIRSDATSMMAYELGVPSPISPDSASALSGARSEAHSEITAYTHDVDVEMTQGDKMVLDMEPAMLASPALSDLSGHLDYISAGSEDVTSYITDPKAYSHIAPNDMYGWNAEYDRKAIVPRSGPETVDDGNRIVPYQRSRFGKNNLLQRVLSVGKAPSRRLSRQAR